MNAVEIEEAISALCEAAFDPLEFPFQFLESFGEKATTIKRLRKGSTNQSDVGGLLQRNNIHLLVTEAGLCSEGLERLTASSSTEKHKAKFALATDGEWVEAENLIEGETLACSLKDLPDHFGFFLPMAGIATVKQIRDNAFDIKATGRMNRLYVELQRANPDWDTSVRREDLNHFFARLIFCFFAEDTGMFPQKRGGLFTGTVQEMSDSGGSNTHEIIREVFRAMNIPRDERDDSGLPRYAASMPYVNGGLFEGGAECPKFTKIARSYLIHIGGLDWTKINPDIFGSMIQAVAEDDERGELGMHYTSVPNILKVLNPLFLDELRQQLEDAAGSKRKLLNLRKRIAQIRVFDPACGSGNFLVVSYKEMRAIEAEINRRRGESDLASDIPLTNFRGIEIRSFAAEVARLALMIVQFQCDLEYRGQQLALSNALPLSKSNWITCGNALRLDWGKLCPAAGASVRLVADDLFSTPLDQPEFDFEHEGGETYLCGNPPYKGRNKKSHQERVETDHVFRSYSGSFSSLDYVCNWFVKAAEFCKCNDASSAFVATSSICQGEQVAKLWPVIFDTGVRIHFAHTAFKWTNLAREAAGVSVIVVGLSPRSGPATLFEGEDSRSVGVIGPYLVPDSLVAVTPRGTQISGLEPMFLGNMPKDGGHLILSREEARAMERKDPSARSFLRPFIGTDELVNGQQRVCLWIEDQDVQEAAAISVINTRVQLVREFRLQSRAASTKSQAARSHRFVQESASSGKRAIVIPKVTSERRPFLAAEYLDSQPVISDKCLAFYDCGLHCFSIFSSSLHRTWIATVCSRLETRFSYGNRTGWNTFPVPKLSLAQVSGLSDCARQILLTRESYWPAAIADMYDPDRIDTEFARLREAHEHNDEVLERIYIGRRFKNDTERLEKLFEMYSAASKKEASA